VGTAEAETVVRVLRIGRDEGIPLVAFLESGGARLQEGAASLGGFGRIFFENVALSGVVPQISVVTGTAAGGACYSPALTDFVVMTESASMFLTGPRVVQEALGEDVTASALGGSRVHARSGVCHFVARDDSAAIDLARELLGYLPQRAGDALQPVHPEPPSGLDPAAVVPAERRRVYDVRTVARAMADGGRLLEVSSKWARNLVTAFAHVDGHVVAIVANQPRHLGGVINADASQKGAWFVRTCNTYGLPLVVLVDTPGFMPGTRQEAAGVIRHGAALLRAFAEATVPRFTVILRKAYGGAYITMNSKDLGADVAFAWPGAEIGVMGARAAVRIVHRREIAGARDHERAAARFADAYARRHLAAATALDLGLIDEVIEPCDTRARLAAALAARCGLG
jgi:acetyl-CoA carboxylase carboxyltransferase component